MSEQFVRLGLLNFVELNFKKIVNVKHLRQNLIFLHFSARCFTLAIFFKIQFNEIRKTKPNKLFRHRIRISCAKNQLLWLRNAFAAFDGKKFDKNRRKTKNAILAIFAQPVRNTDAKSECSPRSKIEALPMCYHTNMPNFVT